MNLFNKKSLIIYFTHTGENYMSDGIRNIEKGNTEIIAEMIKDITGAELFKVETIKDYPYNYKQCTEVALQEKNENARPELKKYLDNIAEYEVIYIGYPNWWGTMPMPMFAQLERLDFTGKIVKPFCTHEGSRMGNSENDIKKICKGATVLQGLPIQGSTVKNAKSKVENWITHLAFYCGWPNAWAAFNMAKEVYAEDGEEKEEHGGMFGLGEPNVNYAQYFIGNSYLKPLTEPEKSSIFIANVTFEPGCRNNWHIHHSTKDGGQILICVDGEGWYQEEGKPAQSLKEGDVVVIPANVKHWHGAKKNSWFSHLALEVPGENTSNEWCEKVTDEEYDKLPE